LYFAFPDDYPILDVRALESLGHKTSRTVYPTDFWVEYLLARLPADRGRSGRGDQDRSTKPYGWRR
jgi:hypothetical protein